MTKAFFFDLETVNGGASRPSGIPPWRATKVAVLGAGMMGAGIALACAAAGMSVFLKDVSMEAATRGRDHAARVLDRLVSKGRRSAEQRDEVLGRITPVDDVSALAGCDLVIEAVFEDTALKHQVFAEVGAVVAADALLASNTSSLPITSLATAVNRPEDFVGLHFFSPVDRMPLVEIVRGAHSSDAAIARAYDVVRQLGKTPIVVNDSRGFFTSRVIGTYLMEGVAMLGEGLPAPSIERAALQAGYPTAPLALIDEVSISLSRRLRNEARAALGDAYVAHPAEAVLDRMLDEFHRPGRTAGGGFYDYEPSRHLWPGLAPTFARPGAQIPFADMKERFLFAEALEALRCLDEGVITSVPEANIGSLFGIGFPPWTGGVLQYIDAYPGGRPAFTARAHALATHYGPRFTPPPSLP